MIGNKVVGVIVEVLMLIMIGLICIKVHSGDPASANYSDYVMVPFVYAYLGFYALKIIFNRKTEGYKQVKGPIGIVEMMPPSWNWSFFWGFLAMFSVWLAFVNLLPIPALDGGHVMFLLYEMISGRPPSEKTLERGQIVGFIIVMGLMAVIFGNDIWNIVKRFL